jgi:hypothetical protein
LPRLRWRHSSKIRRRQAESAAYQEYAGTYKLSAGISRVVSTRQEELTAPRSGRAAETLLPGAPDLFSRKGIEGRILFRRDAAGKVDRRNNEDIIW